MKATESLIAKISPSKIETEFHAAVPIINEGGRLYISKHPLGSESLSRHKNIERFSEILAEIDYGKKQVMRHTKSETCRI